MTTDVEKSHLLTQAIALAERSSGTGGPPRTDVGPLLQAYYRHVSTDDVGDRSAEELYGALASHYRTADTRPQGTARVHVFTPTLAEHGWSAGGHSVVEVVTDDMPFLVDSVVMELARQQRDVHLVIHPQFDVTRDVTGRLETIASPDNESAEPPEGAERESWMHVEISRIGHDEDVDAIALDVQRVLRDVRESVEDWGRMSQQAGVIVERAAGRPAHLDLRRGARAWRRLPRMAVRRPLHLPRLPRVPPRARRAGRLPARRARHRVRHPAQRPRHVVGVRQAAAQGRRDGPRAHPAGAGQGQLPLHRPPPGVPRLRRREDVRQGR